MSTSNGLRAKLRTVREQNCVRSESKIAYGPRAKLRMYGMSLVPKLHAKSVMETRNTASHCAARFYAARAVRSCLILPYIL